MPRIKLDSDTIWNESPEELAASALQVILDSHEKSPERDFDEFLRELPHPWRAVYSTLMLQYEVDNGGFHQFFWNSDGSWNSETREDLVSIDALPVLSLFDKAVTVFETRCDLVLKESSGNSWDAFTSGYEENPLSDLDEQFYELPKSIDSYLGEFIQQNKTDFI